MNTGVQRSSSTPFGASTMTSPAGSSERPDDLKKNMPAIAAAHGIPYVATACPSYPLDLITKVKKASAIDGPSYLHILERLSIGLGHTLRHHCQNRASGCRKRIFPLYEIENGKLQITVAVEKLIPVERYLQPQTRFRHLQPETIAVIRERVKQNWQELLLQSNTTQKEGKNG